MNLSIPKINTFSQLAMLLLAINLIAGYIWIFGFHTQRLLALAFSGTALLFLFFVQKTTSTNLAWKLLLLFYIIYGFVKNFTFSQYPLFLTDISAIGFISTVFLLSKINNNQLKNGTLFLILLSLAYFTYTIPFTNFSLIRSGAFDRIEAITSFGDDVVQGGASRGYVIYATQQLSVAYLLFFLLLLPFVNRQLKKKYVVLLIFISIIFILLFSAFYQKRQPLLELIIIITLSVFFNKKLLDGLLPKNKIISFFIGFIILYAILSANMLSNVFERFTNTLNDIENFDRLEETKQVLSTFDIFDYIFGKGFGYYAPNTPGGIILHIGYSNLLMKGGLILLAFYLTQTIKNIIFCRKKARLFPEYYVGISISIFSMIQLLYAPGYHWFATSIIAGLAMYSRYPLKSIINDKYSNTRTERSKVY